MRLASKRRYGKSTKGRDGHRRYAGSLRGVDAQSRRYYRNLSANIEANQAEIEAIQKRIRDAQA